MDKVDPYQLLPSLRLWNSATTLQRRINGQGMGFIEEDEEARRRFYLLYALRSR